MKRLIGTKINKTIDTGEDNSDTELQTLKTIQNTDGVLEAWLGEHNTYYITLSTLRVVCLKEFQLPTLRDHILNIKEENADMWPPNMEEKLSQQDSAPCSLNIKNLSTRTRQKQIEAKTNSSKKQTTHVKVKHISGNKVSYILKDSSALDEKRMSEEKLQKMTEIAAKYLKTMGVVQDIEPLEIFTHLKKGSDCSFRDIEAFFESKDSNREMKKTPEDVDFTKQRSLAVTTKDIDTLNTTRPNIQSDQLSISSTAQTRKMAEVIDSKSTSPNSPRVRYIKIHGKGRNRRIRIPGADTLGGLPDDSDVSVFNNSYLSQTAMPKRSFSMPETFMNQKKVSSGNNLCKLIPQLSNVTNEVQEETVSDPTSSVLGVTFIVGGSSRGSSFDRDMTYGSVSSDFKSNSDFFSSRECSQEKVSWLKDSTCSRLVRAENSGRTRNVDNSELSPMTSTEVDKETQNTKQQKHVLRASSLQKNNI